MDKPPQEPKNELNYTLIGTEKWNRIYDDFKCKLYDENVCTKADFFRCPVCLETVCIAHTRLVKRSETHFCKQCYSRIKALEDRTKQDCTVISENPQLAMLVTDFKGMCKTLNEKINNPHQIALMEKISKAVMIPQFDPGAPFTNRPWRFRNPKDHRNYRIENREYPWTVWRYDRMFYFYWDRKKQAIMADFYFPEGTHLVWKIDNFIKLVDNPNYTEKYKPQGDK